MHVVKKSRKSGECTKFSSNFCSVMEGKKMYLTLRRLVFHYDTQTAQNEGVSSLGFSFKLLESSAILSSL